MNIIKFLQSFSNPILDKIFILITMMGEETFLILFIALIFWCINKKAGYKLGFAILSGNLLNSALKTAFHTKRPIGQKGIRSLREATAAGFSFPSGHTQGTAELWTVVTKEFKKTQTYILAIILVPLVAISRLYLGVHWPVDVLFGAIFGITWAIICCLIFDLSVKKNNKLIILLIIIPTALTAFFYGWLGTVNTLATLIAFFLGYCIEDKYIKFNVEATPLVQIIKYTLGIGILLLIKYILKMLLPSTIIFDFVTYFLIGLWITCGSTYMFKKLFD